MTLAHLGLGSNLGDKKANIDAAVSAMEHEGMRVVSRSSLYETDPIGPPQPTFINAVIAVETSNDPEELLTVLKRIEEGLGRTRAERWGPREIDIDILLFGDLMLDSQDLVIPHPELTKRSFVLVPLLEMEPGLELPSGEPVSVFADREPEGVRRLDPEGAWPTST